jgi:hypothetical protein
MQVSFIDQLAKGLRYRNYSGLATKWYNLTNPKEVLKYVQILVEEYLIISEFGIECHPEVLRENLFLHYETYYNKYKELQRDLSDIGPVTSTLLEVTYTY